MSRGISYEQVLELAEELPEVERTTSYGTPSVKLRRKMLLRLREDRESLVVLIDPAARDALIADPCGAYFITPHYEPYPERVCVRLALADLAEVRELLIEAWLRAAPERLRAEHEQHLLGE